MNAFDIVVNLWTPELTSGYTPKLDAFWRKVKILGSTHSGVPLDQQLELMDAGRVDKGLLIATTGGYEGSDIHFRKPLEAILAVTERYPERFKPVLGLNPSRLVPEMKRLEDAVKNHGVVGAHLYPHWFGEAPDHRIYYPLYAKCAELGIPLQIQVGHSAQQFLPTVAHPMTLDRVAIDFPELKLIGIHIGYPWTEEMISVAWKHENVYVGSDAHAPRYWDPSFIRFIRSRRGRGKVLFGTDWPVVPFQMARDQVDALDFSDDVLEGFLRGNAARVYGLEDWVES